MDAPVPLLGGVPGLPPSGDPWACPDPVKVVWASLMIAGDRESFLVGLGGGGAEACRTPAVVIPGAGAAAGLVPKVFCMSSRISISKVPPSVQGL
jgi:hypothetical protein